MSPPDKTARYKVEIAYTDGDSDITISNVTETYAGGGYLVVRTESGSEYGFDVRQIRRWYKVLNPGTSVTTFSYDGLAIVKDGFGDEKWAEATSERRAYLITTALNMMAKYSLPRDGGAMMSDPRNNPDDAYEAFLSVPLGEWYGLIRSLLDGGVLTPSEEIGFKRACAARKAEL